MTSAKIMLVLKDLKGEKSMVETKENEHSPRFEQEQFSFLFLLVTRSVFLLTYSVSRGKLFYVGLVGKLKS